MESRGKQGAIEKREQLGSKDCTAKHEIFLLCPFSHGEAVQSVAVMALYSLQDLREEPFFVGACPENFALHRLNAPDWREPSGAPH